MLDIINLASQCTLYSEKLQKVSQWCEENPYIFITNIFCSRGHPQEGDNIYISPQGRKTCRPCNHIRSQAWRDAQAKDLGVVKSDA